MKIILIFLLLLIIISCQTKNVDCVNVSNKISFCVKNSDGQDLLDLNTPNTLNTPKIKIFYLIKGKLEDPYYGNIPKIEEGSSSKIMAVFPNDTASEEYPITYIQWNEKDTDTIKCHYKRSNTNGCSNTYCDKVWYNEKLVFPSDISLTKPETRFVEIIK